MPRKIALTLGLAALSLTATACNTVKGLGRDIESIGEAGDRVISGRVAAADTPA
ncbi:MAG: Entericidin EcnA/B family protein [Sphingomonadaceae bacterium]